MPSSGPYLTIGSTISCHRPPVSTFQWMFQLYATNPQLHSQPHARIPFPYYAGPLVFGVVSPSQSYIVDPQGVFAIEYSNPLPISPPWIKAEIRGTTFYKREVC